MCLNLQLHTSHLLRPTEVIILLFFSWWTKLLLTGIYSSRLTEIWGIVHLFRFDWTLILTSYQGWMKRLLLPQSRIFSPAKTILQVILLAETGMSINIAGAAERYPQVSSWSALELILDGLVFWTKAVGN